MIIRNLGLTEYAHVYSEMANFTKNRNEYSEDEIWVCQHRPIYTVGTSVSNSSGQKNHGIQVIKTDRGGQITYHGPGQLICYPLIDLHRKKIYPKEFLTIVQSIILDVLKELNLEGKLIKEAPGVYLPLSGGKDIFTGLAKVASVGIKISRGCTYHGFSINVAMDLSPFYHIFPCGYEGLRVVNLKDYLQNIDIDFAQKCLLITLGKYFCEIPR